MGSRFAAAAGALYIFVSIGASAQARDADRPFFPAGEPSDAPNGFVVMCDRHPELCRVEVPRQAPPIVAAAFASANAEPSPIFSRATPVADPCVGLTLLDLAPARLQFASATQFLFRAATLLPTISIALPTACSTAALDREFEKSTSSPLNGFAFDLQRNANGVRTVPSGDVAEQLPMSSRPATFATERKLLRQVNAYVNRMIMQRSDLYTTGREESWSRPDPELRLGDCEDLAIEKRMRLLDAGFPVSRLSYAVAYRSGYGLHTLLVARLDDGDYVLDSLAARIVRWDQTSYAWLRLQSTEDPMVWTYVGPRREAPVPAGDIAGASVTSAANS